MKITFILPYFGASGGNRVVAIYAGLLQKRGHQVTLVSQPAQVPTTGRKLKSLIRGRRVHPPVSGSVFLGPEKINHIVLDSSRPPRESDVPDSDVIIATWWETAYWVAALSERNGRKFYFVQHHEIHKHLPWHISRGSYYLPLKKITISQWLVDIMREEYGDPSVPLIHNSVDTEQFHAPPRGKRTVPTVGLMYSATPIKGLDVSLRAIAKVLERIPNLKVVAFGTQPPTRSLPLPIGSEFHLKPSQDRIRKIYASCDAWLFGSREEGFGLPILEAMACRTPVVGTRTGAAPELIDDGMNGHVVDVEDSEALGERLLRVLSLAPDDWVSMSNAALSTTRDYTWTDATDLFERTLIDVAN